MKFTFLKHNLFIVSFLLINSICAQLVSNNSQLQTALSNASAGSEIVLANGVWQDLQISINKNGTATNPITIKAENVGQVFIEGNSNIQLGGSYLFFEGFVFQNASNLISNDDRIDPIIEFRDSNENDCNNCVVSNIKIDSYNGTTAQLEDNFKWIVIYGQNNEISHSSFVGKYGIGSIINDNRNDSDPDYSKIHHNYFASRKPVGEINELNDQDAIRIGNSATSLSSSFTEVYDNLFYDWSGEVEIISNKSGNNKYYNNTFSDYQGTLTLRHGNECEVYNNYFFANNNIFSGGIRVIGEDHKVYNNYIEGVNSKKPDGSNTSTAGGINITNGRPNTEINGYYQVKNATIINNTFVNCDYGLRVGTKVKSDLTLAPENIILANNIFLNTSNNAFDIQTNPTGTSKSEGNITQNGNWDLSNSTNNNQTVASNLLEEDTNFYRISQESAAIDAAIGTYSFLEDDILGGLRTTNTDAGAEEFGANGENLPYKTDDVGVKIGFLSGTDKRISTDVNTLNFNIDESTTTFSVVANVDWIIEENTDWISLNTTTGSNNETIEITVAKNTTQTARTAKITILQNGGDLQAILTVNQSIETFNSNNAVALSSITVTGFGTQDPNIPENTLDDDDDTRWSANSSDGSTYLTYNLGCKKTVTNVKIYFHKGETRTSSFKIATSNDGVNFTDITEILTSSGNTVGFEDFILNPYAKTQYIRILGYGNSENSGWNSYEEVMIFGDDDCSSLSVTKNTLLEKGISFYPNPAKNSLNITAKDQIGFVEVFDITGKKIMSKTIATSTGNIQINTLSKGMYILKIKDAFSRFLVE